MKNNGRACTYVLCDNLARLDNVDPYRLSRSDAAGNTDTSHGTHVESLDAVVLLPVTGEVVGREEFLLVDLGHDTEDDARGGGRLAAQRPTVRVVGGAHVERRERHKLSLGQREVAGCGQVELGDGRAQRVDHGRLRRRGHLGVCRRC